MEDKHYAVLIDADNISSKYIAYILDEMTKYGVITYKRIYGDWTSPQAGRWKDALMENSIVPIQRRKPIRNGLCLSFPPTIREQHQPLRLPLRVLPPAQRPRQHLYRQPLAGARAHEGGDPGLH